MEFECDTDFVSHYDVLLFKLMVLPFIFISYFYMKYHFISMNIEFKSNIVRILGQEIKFF